MTNRTTKTVTISLPPTMADQLDRVRRHDHRTRSELMREALRQYVTASGKGTIVPTEDALPDEIVAFREAQADSALGDVMRLDEFQCELGLFTR